MTIAVPFAIACLAAISVFLVVLSSVPNTTVLQSRIRKLERVDERAPAGHDILINQIVSPQQKSTMRSRLNEAGWYEVTPTALALRGAGALGIGISVAVLLIFFVHNVVLGGIMGLLVALVGWRLPSIALSRAIKARKEMIARDLPEFLDLLSTTVQAGLSLNAAMISSAEGTSGPLRAELDSALSEIRLGRSRQDALAAMSDRANEPSLTMAVSAIVQAEKLGSDLADVLQELAKEARDRRWMRAEEKAAQLPIKMIIPMALFMIPSLYLMIFGPVIAEFIARR
jgi:tight adherence protein C